MYSSVFIDNYYTKKTGSCPFLRYRNCFFKLFIRYSLFRYVKVDLVFHKLPVDFTLTVELTFTLLLWNLLFHLYNLPDICFPFS